jgi:hypothetical protein
MKLDYILPVTIVAAAFVLGAFFPKYYSEPAGPASRSQDYEGEIVLRGYLSHEDFDAIRSALATWAAAPYTNEQASSVNADGSVNLVFDLYGASGHDEWNRSTNIASISDQSSVSVRVQGERHGAVLVKTNGEWRVLSAYKSWSGARYSSQTAPQPK